MNLVIDQMMKLHHVDLAYDDLLVERDPRLSVKQFHSPVVRQIGLRQRLLDVRFRGAVEYRRCHRQTQALNGPPQMGFENLSNVHTRRHAKRIQNEIDRGTVGHVRHVLFRHDDRHHTLVAVPAGHLVANAQLPLHGNVDLDHLDDPRRQLVTSTELDDLFLSGVLNLIELAFCRLSHIGHAFMNHVRILDANPQKPVTGQFDQRLLREFRAP